MPGLRLRPARHARPLPRMRKDPAENGNNFNLTHYPQFDSQRAEDLPYFNQTPARYAPHPTAKNTQ